MQRSLRQPFLCWILPNLYLCPAEDGDTNQRQNNEKKKIVHMLRLRQVMHTIIMKIKILQFIIFVVEYTLLLKNDTT